MPSHAFDSLAQEYDTSFTQTPIAQAIRQAVHARLTALFPRESTVLELGCGTGEDAHFLATQGVNVFASDVSSVMLDVAKAKNAQLPNVHLFPLDLNALSTPPLDLPPLDGAFANFGVINCVHDRPSLAKWLSERIGEGGKVGLCVMSPDCAWEIGWHLLHAQPNIAFRRWRVATFQPDENAPPVAVYCPTPRTLWNDFKPYFSVQCVLPLGVFLPPTALYPVAEKRPRLLRFLLQLEEKVSQVSSLARFADHYWIELKRQGS